MDEIRFFTVKQKAEILKRQTEGTVMRNYNEDILEDENRDRVEPEKQGICLACSMVDRNRQPEEEESPMALMYNFYQAKKNLYDHVGFTEDWVVYAIEDCTRMFWQISNGWVKFAFTMGQFNSDGDYYLHEIYTQHFYEKWVYRGEQLTMIFVDTHSDGNKFFSFFRNELEVPLPE